MPENKDSLKEKKKRRFPPDEDKLKEIIENGEMEMLNTYASDLGEGLAVELEIEQKDEKTGKLKTKTEKELTTSQIRNILDEIQRMKEFDKNALQLLRPKLAYVAGRHGGRVREFQQIIEKAISMVKDNNTFINFKNFVEAIVAYHRYHGGE